MSVCVKCKKEAPCIDIKFALYCSPCFQEATYHKYRILQSRARDNIPLTAPATGLILLPLHFLDSEPLLRASKVLIRFSQLPAIQEPARKNLITYDLAVPECENLDLFLQDLRREYPIPCYLRDIYILKLSGEAIKYDGSYETETHETYSELSNTLKEDLFNAKLLHAQLKLMSQLQVDKAIVPDTSTFLASYILTCTCKGRGQFLPWDSGLVRNYPNNLAIIRPLKEISDREIELYCQETSLHPNTESQKNLPTSAMSIDQLTVNFLSNLETENPGTANVVIRTSSKVSTCCDQSSEFKCPICFAPSSSNAPCVSCSPLQSYFIELIKIE